MKVAAINSSPRKNGNTSIVIKIIFEELNNAGIERAAVVLDMNKALGGIKHKVGVSVVSARRGGALHGIDTMNHFFLNHEAYVVGSTYWNMAYGALVGDVTKDLEGIDNIKNIGQNMAYILNKLNN